MWWFEKKKQIRRSYFTYCSHPRRRHFQRLFSARSACLPAFALQRAVSTTIRENEVDYWTGTVYTTNRRIWEHDDVFKAYLRKVRAYAIDMETATIFTVGFYNKIPTGALLLVSDQPMIPEGVKTAESDKADHQ